MSTARHAAATRSAPSRDRALPSRRLVKVVGLLVVPLSVVLTGAVVATSSYSAFSSATTNPQSAWAAGSVVLTNDSPATALFTATNIKPGQTLTKCIVVSSTGSLPASVRFYATGVADTRSLGSSISLVITQGTGGSAGSCTGFTALASGSAVYSGLLTGLTASSSYATGLGSWTTAGVTTGSESRTYQVTYTLDAATLNTAQLGTADATLTWEAQNV